MSLSPTPAPFAPPAPTAPPAPFDVEALRAHFPILGESLEGHPLVYLDNAATTQKPNSVIEAITDYYRHYNANIHRGLHRLAERATHEFEQTRAAVARFINAPAQEQVIFTGGTTEGINLVAATYGRMALGPGDEILVTGMEHHSNIVPWQMLCAERGARLRVVPITDAGTLDLDALDQELTDRTRLVSVVYASNSLGTVNPVKEIIARAHARGAVVMIDAAQAVAHFAVDVQDLGCDFLAFSAHKLFGPTGLGVLYGRRELLEKMPPYQGGGEMIRQVTFERTTYNDLPYKFEAGTPNIADVIALRRALEFLQGQDRAALEAHEHDLLTYGADRLTRRIDGLRLIGTAPDKIGVLSFVVEGAHPQDIGTLLDNYGIAVRTGNHCTQPVMDRFGLEGGTVRASMSIYNTRQELDYLADRLEKVVSMVR